MVASEDPFGSGSITATVKAGKGHEVPWLVFKGGTTGEVKRHIEEATGLSGEGISLASLVRNASDHFQTVNEVATVLSATVIPETPAESTTGSAPAAEQTPEAPEDQYLSAIASVADLAALGDLYLKNKAVFDGDEKLMAALQARSAELK